MSVWRWWTKRHHVPPPLSDDIFLDSFTDSQTCFSETKTWLCIKDARGCLDTLKFPWTAIVLFNNLRYYSSCRILFILFNYCSIESDCKISLQAYPLDLVRTRLSAQVYQQYYTGIGDTLRSIIRDEGMLALYRGLGPTLLQTAPSLAINYAAYESLRALYVSKHPQRKQPTVRLVQVYDSRRLSSKDVIQDTKNCYVYRFCEIWQ